MILRQGFLVPLWNRKAILTRGQLISQRLDQLELLGCRQTIDLHCERGVHGRKRDTRPIQGNPEKNEYQVPRGRVFGSNNWQQTKAGRIPPLPSP